MKKLVLLLIAVLIIVVGICAYLLGRLSSNENSETVSIDKTENTQNEKQNENKSKTFNTSAIPTNESECANISVITQRDLCYATIAVQTKNAKVCDKITGSAERNACISALSQFR